MAAQKRPVNSGMHCRVRVTCNCVFLQLAADCVVCPEEEVFKNSHIQVIGISPDPVDKQKKFVEKHELTVSLSPFSSAS